MILTQRAIAQKTPGLAPTPPMGWNSWNFFNCNIDEAKIRSMADAMANNGMKDAGYEYIVIDDCWQVARDAQGEIVYDKEKFPNGIKALADYIHSRGLKFGIYSDAGSKTCQGRPGSKGYEVTDAKTYAGWGVDYLKYDWCNTAGQNAKKSYSAMRDALYGCGRPIVFSMCEWGLHKPWKWAGEVSHLWRTTPDIGARFTGKRIFPMSVLQIIDKQNKIRKYNGPNGWNDPDMLEVGNEGLSMAENRAHFSMWCMMASPLIAGNDLSKMDKEVLAILTNRDAVSINQDALGIQCLKLASENGVEIYVKPLVNDNYAFCFLNRSNQPQPIDFRFLRSITDSDFDKTYTINSSYSVHDVWKHQDLGSCENNFSATIPPHDVALLRLQKK